MDEMLAVMWIAGLVLLAAYTAASVWQGRQERILRMEMEEWRRQAGRIEPVLDRIARDIPAVLDKLEDVCAEQLQDWNTVQRQMAQVDGRLGQVERRFGPLAPLAPIDARVDEAPETEPDGPVPVEQEVSHD